MGSYVNKNAAYSSYGLIGLNETTMNPHEREK
jgi:hypothetical protein